MKLVLVLGLVGCTDPIYIGSNPKPDNTIPFTPTLVTFERFASNCGIVDPPFTTTDLFSLSLLGAETSTGTLRSVISLSFEPDVPMAEPIDVALRPFGIVATSTDANGQTTNFFGQAGRLSAGTDASFAWNQGANTNEIDSGALMSVGVRFYALPNVEGGLGKIGVDMTFADGSVFDTEVAEPVHTGFSGCPAG